MANPWGAKSTSWADDSDAAAAAAASAAPAEEAFPSLEQAKSGGKKKKPQAIPLSDFNSGKYSAPGSKRNSASSTIFNHSDRLTSDEMLMLPTGPKERSEEELRDSLPGGRIGGGFHNYGGNRDRERDRSDRPEREGRGFGFEREREASRADDSSDWSVNKPSRDEQRRHRSGGGGGFEQDRFERDSPSKADEVENWAAGKRFVPSEGRRGGGGGDDFGRGGGKADADENWGANKRNSGGFGEKWSFRRSEDSSGPDGGDRWNSRGGGEESERWSDRRSAAPGGVGGDEPRRPRLNLQPRTLPVDSSPPPAATAGENPNPNPSPNANPNQNQNSRPGTPEEEVKPKKKTNPFGDAKPREVLLQERGQDWRKMDMQLENRRPEDEEERKLKQEISNLRELADSTGDPAIKEQVYEKEQELEQLSKELDGKVRVSERNSDRWRKDDAASKAPVAAPAPAAAPQENEWKRGGGDAWKRENGRDRTKVDRW